MTPASSPRKPWYRILYVQVLIAVALGIVAGALFPESAKDKWHASSLKPLGEGFVNLVKMMIAPIIFCTIVHGVASMGDLKKLGRVGFKTLVYFEIVSTVALIIGLIVVNVMQPGAGFSGTAVEGAADKYIKTAREQTTAGFFLEIIPKTFFSAFTGDNLLQVLLVSLLAAFAISALGERRHAVLEVIDRASHVFFGVLAIVVKLAPIGAFGAMAYTVGSYGIGSLASLGKLMAGFYITAGLFVLMVLGFIARLAGFSILRFLAYIKDELLLVLGTSSSETALPALMNKMKRLGCPESTVGVVVPTGYSFNLDGTNIYLTMGALFLAQAKGIHLSLGQQITLLLFAMLTSKGASGVTGAGLVALAATLQTMPVIPLESIALLVGIDRFMSECRALTNFIGNGIATIVVSRWEGEVSAEALRERMNAPSDASSLTN